VKRWTVERDLSGMSLQAFLKHQLGETVSAKQIKRSVDGGKCMLNGKPERFASRLVGLGDTVAFDPIGLSEKNSPLTIEISKRVLYQDESLIAYDKPAGIISESPKLLHSLQQQFGSLILLHRLDKDTTGVLLFARNPSIAKTMERRFKERSIKKCYLAIVHGVPAHSKGTVENYLGKLQVYQGQTIWGAVSQDKGLFAKTTWEIKEKGKEWALLICYPETGRTHQIRVHLSSLGHAILGDHQYGRQSSLDYHPKRFLLHASSVTFEHPQHSRLVTISAPVPEDFKDALKCLSGRNDE
jgi:RluA family pseudouridine synthase